MYEVGSGAPGKRSPSHQQYEILMQWPESSEELVCGYPQQAQHYAKNRGGTAIKLLCALFYVGREISKKEEILDAKHDLGRYDPLLVCQYCYDMNIKYLH
eukprot:10148999-Ditylum_brightwellii.AAC.1